MLHYIRLHSYMFIHSLWPMASDFFQQLYLIHLYCFPDRSICISGLIVLNEGLFGNVIWIQLVLSSRPRYRNFWLLRFCIHLEVWLADIASIGTGVRSLLAAAHVLHVSGPRLVGVGVSEGGAAEWRFEELLEGGNRAGNDSYTNLDGRPAEKWLLAHVYGAQSWTPRERRFSHPILKPCTYQIVRSVASHRKSPFLPKFSVK